MAAISQGCLDCIELVIDAIDSEKEYKFDRIGSSLEAVKLLNEQFQKNRQHQYQDGNMHTESELLLYLNKAPNMRKVNFAVYVSYLQ